MEMSAQEEQGRKKENKSRTSIEFTPRTFRENGRVTTIEEMRPKLVLGFCCDSTMVRSQLNWVNGRNLWEDNCFW